MRTHLVGTLGAGELNFPYSRLFWCVMKGQCARLFILRSHVTSRIIGCMSYSLCTVILLLYQPLRCALSLTGPCVCTPDECMQYPHCCTKECCRMHPVSLGSATEFLLQPGAPFLLRLTHKQSHPAAACRWLHDTPSPLTREGPSSTCG